MLLYDRWQAAPGATLPAAWTPVPWQGPHAARPPRAAGGRRPLLIGCLPAGWPAAIAAGAYAALASACDMVELALPTPFAPLDGDTMRAAYGQALESGYHHGRALALSRRITAAGTPVLVMAYWHVIAEAGVEEMARRLAGAGVTAVVVPDLPAGCVPRWAAAARAAGLGTILLAAAAETPEDLDAVAAATAAVYLPAAPGPTGTAAGLHPRLAHRVQLARRVTGLPVIAGIGISTPQRAAEAVRAGADAVVIGSAFADAVTRSPGDPAGAVRELAAAIDRAMSAAARERRPGEGRPGCADPPAWPGAVSGTNGETRR